MKSFFGNLLGIFSNAWWIEISTTHPQVVYYFGPFNTEDEALLSKQGYIDDLQAEGAQNIQAITSRRATPDVLTIETASKSVDMTPVLTHNA